MFIRHVDLGPPPRIRLEAEAELKADTPSHGIVKAHAIELQGLHLEDVRALEPGPLEGANLDVLGPYLTVKPGANSESGIVVTDYSVIAIPGLVATVLYGNTSNPEGEGRSWAVVENFSETMPA